MALRVQYAQKVSEEFNERQIIHFETDSDIVLIGNTNRTLTEVLNELDAKRDLVLSGGVTGKVTIDGHSPIRIETKVTDDGHEHSGSTVKVGTADRVVITAADKSIVVSDVTSEELKALSGIKDNIQDQLDNKVKKSKTNGKLLVDGTDIDVYVHPDKEVSVTKPDTSTMLGAGTKLTSVKEIAFDEQGHVEKLETEMFEMPQISRFWVGTEEPTNQVLGDFWLETLNVEVPSNSFFVQDANNIADTTVIGEGTESYFNLTDIKTGVTESAGHLSDYNLLDPT